MLDLSVLVMLGSVGLADLSIINEIWHGGLGLPGILFMQ